MTVGFGGLQDFSDGRILLGNEISVLVGYCVLRDLNDGRFSLSVIFFFVLYYEFSMIVGFVPLQVFKNGRLSSVTRFH